MKNIWVQSVPVKTVKIKQLWWTAWAANRGTAWTLFICSTMCYFTKCAFSSGPCAACPQTSTAPGTLKRGQAHNMNLVQAGQKVKQWGAISAKMRLNRGQHAEMKLQAIPFIHINLGKVAKRVKLIRLIDFFSLALSRCLSPYLAMILTCTGW